jgi:hypothetical protein
MAEKASRDNLLLALGRDVEYAPAVGDSFVHLVLARLSDTITTYVLYECNFVVIICILGIVPILIS